MGRVALDQVSKRFDDVAAVDDLTLDVADEEFLVLLGPSGCGKSTALRMIAGLEDPPTGTITIGDRVVNDVEAKDRDIAMVFQSYALYPHMTVRRNIEFPLRSRKVPAAERATAGGGRRREPRPRRACSTASPRSSRAGNVSGSRSARAIVRRPQAFLMDEPLSNLDAKLRVQTRAELVELQRRLAATIIYVTHDQVEAMTMGHRIAVLDARRAAAGRRAAGRLRRAGQPLRGAVHRQPADEHRRPAASTASTAASSAQLPGGGVPVPAELVAGLRGGRGRGGGDRGAARRPALRRSDRRRRRPRDGERGRVAGPRAPRGVPPRRPAVGDRAPGRPRAGAGRGEHRRTSWPTPTRCTCSIPRPATRIGD